MLTQKDLLAIGNLIDTKIHTVLRTELRTEIQREMKKELSPIKSQLRTMQSGLDAVVRFFDNELVSLEKRVSHLEIRE